jgi:hypothetical protein
MSRFVILFLHLPAATLCVPVLLVRISIRLPLPRHRQQLRWAVVLVTDRYGEGRIVATLSIFALFLLPSREDVSYLQHRHFQGYEVTRYIKQFYFGTGKQ